MISRNSIQSAVAAALAATLLAACGGSDSTPVVPPPPGDGLTQMQREDRDGSSTVPGLLTLATAMLASMTGESGEPRAIDGIAPPTSETAEPSALAP